MTPRVAAVGLGMVLAILTVPLATADSPSLPPLIAEKPAAPSFRARTLDGGKIELADLVRRGPVVVDFWATWCKPCLYALPELQRIHQRYAAQGVTVIGISEDGPRNFAKVRPFVSRYALTYPVVVDEDGSLQSRWQVRSLPTTFVVDRRGRIAWTHQGYQPGLEEMIDRAVQAALADTVSGDAE